MEVGVITYHRSINYGAQLQAFALIKVLQNLGHQAEIIDCNSIGVGKIFHWNLKSLRGFLGALRNNALSILTEFKRRKLFDNFVENYIPKSEPCTTQESLKKIVKKYDYVITGSDQVWHPQICEGKKFFFLDIPIPSTKKIAYAPSFGVDNYSQQEASVYMPLINKIEHLSVRETTGNEVIERYLGKKVKEVVDPTILLDKEEWEKLTSAPKYSDYILYFTILDEPSGMDTLVRKIADKKKLKIVRIGSVRDILKSGFINGRISGPLDFLSLVKNADVVVTSSFHGLVFSILFHKDFIGVLNNNERNSRLKDLAQKLGLSDRLISNFIDFDLTNIKPINWKKIDNIISELRKDSLIFLDNAIKTF